MEEKRTVVVVVVVLINESFSVLSSYLRTMTALLDPTQIEERERRRLKQLEQQVVGGGRGRGGVRNTGREAAFLNTPPPPVSSFSELSKPRWRSVVSRESETRRGGERRRRRKTGGWRWRGRSCRDSTNWTR